MYKLVQYEYASRYNGINVSFIRNLELLIQASRFHRKSQGNAILLATTENLVNRISYINLPSFIFIT